MRESLGGMDTLPLVEEGEVGIIFFVYESTKLSSKFWLNGYNCFVMG